MTLAHLYASLDLAGFDPDPERVADALWLAALANVPNPTAQVQDPPTTPVGGQPGGAIDRLPAPNGIEAVPPDAAAGDQAPAAPVEASTPSMVDLHLDGSSPAVSAPSRGGASGSPLRVPRAPALPGSLTLARALRPLRKQSSRSGAFDLDEAATAHHAAETGLWLPILVPSPERWLDLALILDTAPSMVIWQSLAREFRLLLERLGAFRDVRVWHLDTSRPQPVLTGQSSLSEPRDPRELIDPSGRRLSLIFSDTVGPAWRAGGMQPLARQWSSTGPIAVIQPLPQRLWNRSALRTTALQVRAHRPAQPGSQLELRARTRAGAGIVTEHADVVIPVLEIEQDWLGPWARLVADAGPGWTNCAVVALPSPEAAWIHHGTAAAAESADDQPLDPVARVRRFRAAASPAAFRLAGLLSAVPISLRVIRLVQGSMLPTTTSGQLAEVFLGGLLCRTAEEETERDADDEPYDFLPGVREALANTLTHTETDAVTTLVSRYLTQRFGQPRDFTALAVSAETEGTRSLDPASKPFAAVARTAAGEPIAARARPGVISSVRENPNPVRETDRGTERSEFDIEVLDHQSTFSPAPMWRGAITRPMLYVGLGGTGCQIGSELERQLRAGLCGQDGMALIKEDPHLRPFQLPPFLQFVYADLNEAEISRARRNAVPVPEEHFAAAAFTQHVANRLVPRRVDSYPEVAMRLRFSAAAETRKWLPPQNGEPRVAPLTKGAGQLPTVGRAALFESLRIEPDRVLGPLTAAIAGIAKSGGMFSSGGVARAVTDCDVFVGFSVAGGTGSGIFYDFLHLIGEQFRSCGIRVQIHPVVLMPSAFNEFEGGGRKARLNAATALLDLFRLVDDQNSPGRDGLLGVRSRADRISVRYPDLAVTLFPATVQTAFLFGGAVTLERDDLHRSIVSFILSMVGTVSETRDGRPSAPDHALAADFVNQVLERQSPSYSGIGRRPVSTSLVASMTTPVDELADIVSSRLLARAVSELAGASTGDSERNRSEIDAFYAACGLEALRAHEPLRFREPAPRRGYQAVTLALHTRVIMMEGQLPVLASTLRNSLQQLARDFDYRRGVRGALAGMDPFRLCRVVSGDPQSPDTASRLGFAGSLESMHQPEAASAEIGMSLPPSGALRRRFGRQTDWADPEVREIVQTQNAWYMRRTEQIWNAAWGGLAYLWDPTVARLRAEVGGLAGAFLECARAEQDSFVTRCAELYRHRSIVTYLLPPIGDLEGFYLSVLRRFPARPDLGLRPAATEAEVVNSLLGPGGWLAAYNQVSPDSHPDARFDAAVGHVRSVLRQAVKTLFADRGTYGDQPPLLPSLRNLLAESAGMEPPAIGERDLRTFQRGLAGLLPVGIVPEGIGRLRILVAYPQAARDPALERYIEDKLNLPVEPNQTLEFRAVDAESVTVVMLRTAMGLSEVPEIRRIMTEWSDALHHLAPRDFLAWRQRLGYDFRWLASTAEDRVRIMHHMLCAVWNGQVSVEGRLASPERIIVSLSGEEPSSVAFTVESYGRASSWTDLLRAYETWVFSDGGVAQRGNLEFCARLMRTAPVNPAQGSRPSELYIWFMEQLVPQQVRVLTTMLEAAPASTQGYIASLREFWTHTVPAAADLLFQSTRDHAWRNLHEMLDSLRYHGRVGGLQDDYFEGRDIEDLPED